MKKVAPALALAALAAGSGIAETEDPSVCELGDASCAVTSNTLLQVKVKTQNTQGLSRSDIQTFMDETNKYRCMHGADPVTWNEAIAQGSQAWAEQMPPMNHADS
eukprot:TRINITY_DN1575_c0_g1_i5.p1 TRINITY_DN1575_c0_g1~~TRINITY_DN1575_c0_g1_i5.p1  ORF type:complete len:105 (+),score=17.68 TRINITY_DN1575_c0_g1_i5:103-417(+)